MKELGINRVSYGIQTLDVEALKGMNRDYNVEESIEDIKNLLEIIGNVNIDTMYGFEGEDTQMLIHTIDTFVELGVPAISIYSLDNQRCDFNKSTSGPAVDEHKKEKLVRFEKAKEFLYAKGFKDILQNIFIKENSPASYKHQLRRWDNLTLLALGVGSQGYAPQKIYQNSFKLSDYYAKLDEGVLPLEYVTLLSRELEFSREVTSKIRFTKLDIAAVDKKYTIVLENIFAKLIKALLELEFITVREGILEKTAKSSYYINIIPLLFSPDSFKEELFKLPQAVIDNYPIPKILTSIGKTECKSIFSDC